jgi:hypothetical protein
LIYNGFRGAQIAFDASQMNGTMAGRASGDAFPASDSPKQGPLRRLRAEGRKVNVYSNGYFIRRYCRCRSARPREDHRAGRFQPLARAAGALAIHLCIGMAYGFSVFWLPLGRALGITQPVACPDLTLISALTTTTCDWRVADLGWIYTLFFVVLGSSAALWGGWLERVGPRRAGVVAACCWCGGIAIAAIGVSIH